LPNKINNMQQAPQQNQALANGQVEQHTPMMHRSVPLWKPAHRLKIYAKNYADPISRLAQVSAA